MATTFEDVCESRHILLTTFTKSGIAKPTTVWIGLRDGRMVVYTGSESWKAKRIRNNPRVTVEACTMRGKSRSDSVEAIAHILEGAQTAEVKKIVIKRQGILAQLMNIVINATRGPENNIAIEIRSATADAPHLTARRQDHEKFS